MVCKSLIEKYRENLTVSDKTPAILLHEGNISLIPARNLPDKLGFNGEIYLKFEGMNPTGSFKDIDNDDGSFKSCRSRKSSLMEDRRRSKR
jgi:threonine synthase